MVSTTIVLAIASPVIIILIVLLIMIISNMRSTSNMNEELKRMKKNVNINSEAVDMIIPWVSAAQKTFMIPGFGSY